VCEIWTRRRKDLLCGSVFSDVQDHDPDIEQGRRSGKHPTQLASSYATIRGIEDNFDSKMDLFAK
jgi:hypothetical protein